MFGWHAALNIREQSWVLQIFSINCLPADASKVKRPFKYPSSFRDVLGEMVSRWAHESLSPQSTTLPHRKVTLVHPTSSRNRCVVVRLDAPTVLCCLPVEKAPGTTNRSRAAQTLTLMITRSFSGSTSLTTRQPDVWLGQGTVWHVLLTGSETYLRSAEPSSDEEIASACP